TTATDHTVVAQSTEPAPVSPEEGEAGAAVSGAQSGTDVDPSTRHEPRYRVAWLVSCLAFFLLGAGWAVALPADGTYDESQHLVRAYGVASGQVYSPPAKAARGGGAYFEVPRSLLPDNVSCP